MLERVIPMKQLTAVVIGAGNRGTRYTDIMYRTPEKYKVVAVAEPIESRRNYIRDKHGISEDMCFDDWKPLFAKGKIADFAIVSTMDRQHFEPAMAAIDLGYDLLLEKPISPEPAECRKIALAAKKKGVKIVVCHVLRYSDMFTKLKQLIDDGAVGDIVSINHEECVGNVHQSHSFIRGNWGNSERSSFMLLQKSCHDIDILQWLIGKKCKKVQSFGSLSYFKRKNAPEGSPEYCYQGCPVGEKCPYNAVKLYFDDKKNSWFRTTCTRLAEPTDDDVMNSLKTTQYGKCVFKCDNDVVDHQTVNLLYDDDITVTFTMNAFNRGGRNIHIMGTKGEIHAAIDDESPIEVYNFETKEKSSVSLNGGNDITGGHGGGDDGIVRTLYDYFTDNYTGKAISGAEVSCENHLTVFAAEASRISGGKTVDIDEFIKSLD